MMLRHTLSRRGFTLIELLITVAVVALVLTLAAPSLRDFVLLQRLKSLNAQVVSDLQWARSESISRGQPVRVRFQRTAEGTRHDLSCYIIYIDTVLNASAATQFSDPPCDCKADAGTRCNGSPATTTELRTVQIESSRSVLVDVAPFVYRVTTSATGTTTQTTADHVGFDPRTGGVGLFATDTGVLANADFMAYVLLSDSQKYALQVGRTGRVKSCIPAGSTLPGETCS
jgi:type IV fimbrial biogenesis protein FimT